jgi:asparagine synthase (glutamine-hydrolysing)
MRLGGNKKVGIFLSGGIDSVVLLAIYKKLFPKRRIETFTAVFENDQNKTLVGEHEKVKAICKHFKCKSNIVRINSKELIKSFNSSSYPSTGLLEFCFKKLAEKARNNNTEVILSGEGADEMFFGYDHNLALIGIFKKRFNFLRKKYKLRNLLQKKKNLSNYKIEDLFLFGGADINLENNRKKIFLPKIHRTRSLKSTITNTIKKLNLKNPYDVDKIIVNIDYLIKIPELQIRRAEEPAMGKGVEVRFPYLNEELKSLVNSIRLEEKIDKNLVDKILLRKIAKKLVPKKLQSDKLPFGVPAIRKQYFSMSKTKFEKPAFNNLFYQNFKNLKKIILKGKHRKLNFFQSTFLKKIICLQENYETCFFDSVLWRVWSFASWYEKTAKSNE